MTEYVVEIWHFAFLGSRLIFVSRHWMQGHASEQGRTAGSSSWKDTATPEEVNSGPECCSAGGVTANGSASFSPSQRPAANRTAVGSSGQLSHSHGSPPTCLSHCHCLGRLPAPSRDLHSRFLCLLSHVSTPNHQTRSFSQPSSTARIDGSTAKESCASLGAPDFDLRRNDTRLARP